MSTNLAESAVLLSWDPEKKKLRGDERRNLVSGAVLVDLWFAGHVSGEKTVAVAGDPGTRAVTRDLPPEQVAMLARIHGSSRARTWKHWIQKDSRATWTLVRDRMAADGVLTVQEKSFLGFDTSRVEVRDPRAGAELRERCRRILLGSTPPASVDRHDAALIAVVAATELNTVFSGRERRRHRDRVKQLSERCGPAAKALRKVVADNQAATVAAAS